MNRGVIKQRNGCPNEFMAVISDLSANPPINIMEANKTANGRAKGIKVMLEYHNNSSIIFNSSPFPIKSSIYFQRNCIKRINITTENVNRNGRIKDEKINFLKIFTLNLCVNHYEPNFFIKSCI